MKPTKKNFMKKIEIWCKQYIVCVVLYSFILGISSLGKDSVNMRNAFHASAVLAISMATYINWRRRNENGVDLEHEEAVKKFDESHAYLIKRRCMKLKEELKDRFADMGVKWVGSYNIDVEEDSFRKIIELEALMIYDPEADGTDFKKELEENKGFVFIYPLPSEQLYVTQMSKVKLMTEEEIIERKALKGLHII